MPSPKNRFTIQLRLDQPPGQRNFTACHEIGHILFKTHHIFPNRGSDPGSILSDYLIEERLCEEVAAALLMPDESFSAEARSLQPSLTSIDVLARLFDVSFGPALLRVAETAPWVDAALVEWSPSATGCWFTARPRLLGASGRQLRWTLEALSRVDLGLETVAEGRIRSVAARFSNGWVVESTRVPLGVKNVVVSVLRLNGRRESQKERHVVRYE
jgi:hypothetical protein